MGRHRLASVEPDRFRDWRSRCHNRGSFRSLENGSAFSSIRVTLAFLYRHTSAGLCDVPHHRRTVTAKILAALTTS